MAKNPEKPITFDSEGDLHDEINAMVANINNCAAESPELLPYINGLNDMHRLFRDNYRKNVKLLEKSQEYNAQLVLHASKIKVLLDLTDKDRGVLSELKGEYDEASRMVEFANTAENKSKELLASLRTKVTALAAQVQRGEAFCFGEEGSLFDISQEVKNLTKEKDAADREIATFQSEIKQGKDKVKLLKETISGLKGEQEKLESSIDQNERILTELKKSADENRSLVVDLKPVVVKQKEDLESVTKSKTEHTGIKQTLKANYYDQLSAIGQLRDEGKSLKERILRRGRYLTELKSKGQRRDEQVDLVKRHITSTSDEFISYQGTLADAEKKGEELEIQYSELVDQSRDLSDKKAEVRIQSKKLRSDLVTVQLNVAQSSNETKSKERDIASHLITLHVERNKEYEAVKETKDAKDLVITAKGETRSAKHQLQRMKEKILRLFTEIDEKKHEKFQTDARIQMTKDTIIIIDEQNKKDMVILDEYKRKLVDQTHLTEKLRDERNESKKQCEAAAKEFEQLTAQQKILETEYNRMQTEERDVLESTVETRARNIEVVNNQGVYSELIKQAKIGIQEAERTISRFQAEVQTMNHILTEAQHDHLQIQKEHQVLHNNLTLLRNETMEKAEILDKLRSEIQTSEGFLAECSKAFNEKKSEIQTSMTELAALDLKTQELEAKREKLKALEYHMHRTATESIFEKQKAAALIHEFSVQRNVHRWQVLEAVEPGYVKNLKYRAELYAKLDKAHCELEVVLKERDQLKKDADKLQKQMEGAMSKAHVMAYIEQYTADIKEKDAEIAELKKLVNGNKPGMNKTIQSIEDVRLKVSERRENTAKLRTRSVAALRPKSEAAWFLTEAPVATMLGGGFLSKPPSELRTEPEVTGMSIRKDMKISSSLMTPSSDRRAKSTLLSAKLAHHIKIPQPRSPSRRVVLPSLH